MLVISDTSPIRALNAVGQLELLRILFREVVIPPAVAAELRRSPSGFSLIAGHQHPFLRLVTPSDIESIDADLDPGEREAICLARELHADWLLIDERAGHDVATRLGIPTIGVLGVIMEAKKVGLLSAAKPIFDQLLQSRFFISSRLYQQLLNQIGE